MSDKHPADEAFIDVIDKFESVPNDRLRAMETAAKAMADYWKEEHPDAGEAADPLEPGIYDIAPHGECTPLVTESGGGDRKLFYEILEERGTEVDLDD